MRARFQRGGVKGVSPFFAFQDIITSAMAVLIAIIMLLAVYMGGSQVTGAPSSKAHELAVKLQALLDEITRLKKEEHARLELAKDQSLDPQLVKTQIKALREELAANSALVESEREKVRSVPKMEGVAIMRSELEQQQKRVEEARARLAQLEKDAASGREQMERAEKEVKDREAQLLAERALRNQVWLIPERSTSTKQPLLVTVSGDELTLQRYNNPEKETLNGSQITRGFEAALNHYSKMDYYVVFYFKASGAANFARLTETARKAGYEIGYDTVRKNVVINFNAPK